MARRQLGGGWANGGRGTGPGGEGGLCEAVPTMGVGPRKDVKGERKTMKLGGKRLCWGLKISKNRGDGKILEEQVENQKRLRGGTENPGGKKSNH